MKTEIKQALEFFEKRNNIDLAYAIEIDTKKPGKHVVITGAVHGSEVAGVMASIDTIKRIEKGELELLSGKVTFILANPEAFKVEKRFLDINMNRMFLEENLNSNKTPRIKDSDPLEGVSMPSEPYELTRAREIMLYLETQEIDMVLDIHTFSVSHLEMLVYSDSKMTDEVAEISDIPNHFIVKEELGQGYLVEYFTKKGIFSFTMECGNYKDPRTNERAHKAIINTLEEYGLLPGKNTLTKPNQILIYDYLDRIVPEEGLNSWIKM
jgi:predicted deacylase